MYCSEFVPCDYQATDLPAFGKIDDTIVTPLLSIRLFSTPGITNHLLSYAIKHAQWSSLILVSQLKYPEPLSAHNGIGDSNIYIAVQSHIPNTAH